MPVNINTCRVLVFFKAGYLRTILLCAIFYLFIFLPTCFAQRDKIDSLQKILPALKDTSRIDCMNALSFQYIRLLVRDSAEYFEAIANKESKALGYIHGIAESVSNQSGIFEYFDNDFIKAEVLARESLEWFKKTSNKNGINETNSNLWFAVFAQSKYDDAYSIALKQYEIFKAQNNASKMIDALQGLGVVQFQKGNYDSAFYFYQQSQQLAIANKDKVWISDMLRSFGTLYRAIGDYQTAINNYRKVFQTDTRETIQKRIDGSYETWARMEFAELFSLTNQFDSAWHYYNLFDTTKIADKDLRIYLVSTGETYLLQHNYEKALQNFWRGLTMHRKLNDRNEIKRVLLDIAKTYFALGNNSAALQYAREGLEMSLQTKSRQFIRNGYQTVYLVYDRLHETDSAYFYYQKYIAIKDIVVSDQTKGTFAAYKYEQQINLINNEKLISGQQLKIRQQQLAQSSFQKKILIIGFICLIIVSAIIFRTISLKRKNERSLRELAENELQIQKLESEKSKAELRHQATELEMQALRAQMNPHFIFNCLSSINKFVLKNESESASDYLTKFSRLIRMVLTNSKKSFITLEDELEMLRLYLEMERLRFQYSFDYHISFKNEIDPENIFIPSLLLQPFAENAIWHGLMHKEGNGYLEIALSLEEKILICTITDNGIGRYKASEIKSKSAAKQKSMGLQITAERLALLNLERNVQTSFDIEDITDDRGNPTGTKVTLRMHYRDLTEMIA